MFVCFFLCLRSCPYLLHLMLVSVKHFNLWGQNLTLFLHKIFLAGPRGGSSLKPFKFTEARLSKHRHSQSDPVIRKAAEDKLNNILKASYYIKLNEMGHFKPHLEAERRQSPTAEVQNSLKQEIVQLQERLQDQFVVRHALEKTLSYRPFSLDTIADKSIPKDAKELIKEIIVLELEVVYLEHYLLSLYRKTFDQTLSSLSNLDGRLNSKAPHSDIPEKENSVKECNGISESGELLDSGIHRSHSSLSQRSAYSIRTSPPQKSLAKAVNSYHSLPLSMLEQAQSEVSNGVSLGEHFGTCVFDHAPETANWLSEEMIKCISDIYCELADPPLIDQNFPFSYSSSPLDILSSSQGQGDIWSPQNEKNSFRESKEFSGPYCSMAKVERICRDEQKLRDIEHKLQYYRSLVYRLEEADPKRMKHEEKLAFWINVHNALVMHAFLVYGVPKNNLKRISLLLKAAYNVGGQTINVNTIQNSILRCRMPRPGQWLRFLFSSKAKLKAGEARKTYMIEHPEPRLHFALCAGSYSDPAVRLYTPKRVFQDLEIAKEDYIQSNLSVNKEPKILLPKIVESFAKDSDTCPAGLLEMIEHFMPDSSTKKNIQRKKPGKSSIQWMPHNFTFRYLLSKELA